MIKVLHFFKTYYPDSMGGIEQVIFQLAEGGARQGVQSEVLYLSRRGSARGEVIGNHLAHRSKLDLNLASTGFSFSAIQDFAELSKKADLIHYHFPWPFMDVLHFATRVRKPTVVSYHSDVVKQKNLLKMYRPLMNRFLKSVDRIVAASPNYVASSPVLSQYSEKVSIIPYGLDSTVYPTPSSERLNYWRNELGERFFLFIGAFRYYKGLHYLLDAVKENDIPLVIIGSGALDTELRAKATRENLRNVHFLGTLSDEDKMAVLTLCYGVVFPSYLRSEAFGISLLEGAMLGKPLISCEIGTGTTYINIDGETGLVVPPESPSAISHAMQTLWSQPILAKRMGRSAAQRYKERFSAETMILNYTNLYRELLYL